MSDTKVMVSVFCITFNHRNYIERCLNSLIDQKTDFKYEILVHDDASTDGTQEIIREYAEKYPDLIIPVLQEKNQYSQGADILKHFLLPIASGEYIVECEGDDFWCDPEKLQMQVEALENHPECVLCVHETNTVDKEGNPQDLHFPMTRIDHCIISTSEFMYLTLDKQNWLFHLSAFMVSKQLFDAYMEYKATGFPSKFYRAGDLPLYLYFAMQGDIYYIDRVMSVYTVESGGFMSRVRKDKQFAYKVHQGYIDGLLAFDEFSGHRFSEGVQKALVVRKFETARIDRRFDELVSDPAYKPFINTRSIPKRIGIYSIGYLMLFLRRFKKRNRIKGA